MKQLKNILKKRISTTTVVLVLIGIIALGIIIAVGYNIISKNLPAAITGGPTTPTAQDDTNRLRLVLWKDSTDFEVKHPILGWYLNTNDVYGDRAYTDCKLPTSFTPLTAYYFNVQWSNTEFRINAWGLDSTNNKLKLYAYSPNYQYSGACRWTDDSSFANPTIGTDSNQVPPSFRPTVGHPVPLTGTNGSDFRFFLWGCNGTCSASNTLKVYVYTPPISGNPAKWEEKTTDNIGGTIAVPASGKIPSNFVPKAGYSVYLGNNVNKIHLWGTAIGSNTPLVYVGTTSATGVTTWTRITAYSSVLPTDSIILTGFNTSLYTKETGTADSSRVGVLWIQDSSNKIHAYKYDPAHDSYIEDKTLASGVNNTAFVTGFPISVKNNDGACEFSENSNTEYACTACVPISVSGNPADKYNIVFMSDSYDATTIQNFQTEVNAYVNALFSLEPLKTQKNKFNVYTIPKIGSIVPAGHGYDVYNYWDLSSCQKVDMVVVAEAPTTQSKYGNGGSVSFFEHKPALIILDGWSRMPGMQPIDTFVHEFGHGFGGLGDEYPNSQNINMGTWPDLPKYINGKWDYGSFYPSYTYIPNIDQYGCPKWCSGSINHDAQFTEILNGVSFTKKCADVLDPLMNCANAFDKTIKDGSSCYKDLLTRIYNLKSPTDEELKSIDLPVSLFKCDIGVNCRQNTGCYWNARSLDAFRSSVYSIMNMMDVSGAKYSYNLISKEAMMARINKLGLK